MIEFKLAIEIIVGMLIPVVVWLVRLESKVTNNVNDLKQYKPLILSHETAIKARNEELREIHRRLDKIDEMNLEATLAKILTKLDSIEMELQKNRR